MTSVLSAQQRKFPLLDQTLTVLLTVNGARDRLPGHDEDDILSLAFDGHLVAWDIARGSGKVARELRIFPPSVDHYARTGCQRPLKAGTFARTWEMILLKQDQKPWMTSKRVALLLNCSPTHVTALVDDGALAQLDGTKYRRGPGGAACITRDSFASFLQSRLL